MKAFCLICIALALAAFLLQFVILRVVIKIWCSLRYCEELNDDNKTPFRKSFSFGIRFWLIIIVPLLVFFGVIGYIVFNCIRVTDWITNITYSFNEIFSISFILTIMIIVLVFYNKILKRMFDIFYISFSEYDSLCSQYKLDNYKRTLLLIVRIVSVVIIISFFYNLLGVFIF